LIIDTTNNGIHPPPVSRPSSQRRGHSAIRLHSRQRCRFVGALTGDFFRLVSRFAPKHSTARCGPSHVSTLPEPGLTRMNRPHLTVMAVQPLHLSIKFGDSGDRDDLHYGLTKKSNRRRGDAYRSKSSFPIGKVRLGRETTVCAELQILSGADRRWDLVAAQHSTYTARSGGENYLRTDVSRRKRLKKRFCSLDGWMDG
jgi:hypothetical protein